MEGIMRGLFAPLSLKEETTFRRIGFGTEGELDLALVRRLLHLELIEWSGANWRLTSLGRRRYELLVQEPNGTVKPAA
jgi:hypothetical protein